ncbi:Core-2/I-Branching enzyme [Cooperia oncophora]
MPFQSYDFIEDELAASYHPQNVFCYSVDKKAKASFNTRIELLSRCLQNVLVTRARFSVTSSGLYQNHAFYECHKLLIQVPGWGYLIQLQNYDVMIKSVYETVAILQALDGANDIGTTICDLRRWDHAAKWEIGSLKLFPSGTKLTWSQLNTTLLMTCSLVQASLSRATVDWIVNTVYGADEILWATLQTTVELGMPGRISSSCSKANKRGVRTPYFTRYSFILCKENKGITEWFRGSTVI